MYAFRMEFKKKYTKAKITFWDTVMDKHIPSSSYVLSYINFITWYIRVECSDTVLLSEEKRIFVLVLRDWNETLCQMLRYNLLYQEGTKRALRMLQ